MPAPFTSEESADVRSLRLWTDPLAAPDVPGEFWLERWLAGESDLDLNEQMNRAPNCRRAAKALRREVFRRAVLGRSPAPPAAKASDNGTLPKQPDRGDGMTCAVGALVETKTEVRLFDPDRAQWRLWRLGRPPTAVLVEGPMNLGYDRLWRAVLAIPEFVVPDEWLGEDELVLNIGGTRWLVFPSLEYPLSEGQIARMAGAANERGVEVLLLARAARAEGLPLPPELAAGTAGPNTPGRGEHLERVLEEAAWLAAEADARLAAAQWEEELQELLKETAQEDYFAVLRPEAQPAFARGTEIITPVFVLAIAEGETWKDVLRRFPRLEEAATPVIAVLKQKPTDLGSGCISAVWKLRQPLAAKIASPTVLVVDSLSKNVLGQARIDTEGVVRWDVPSATPVRTPVEQLVLILFLPA